MMGSKRKPESPLRSEPSSKIRRIDKNLEDHEDFQYTPVVYSPQIQQDQQGQQDQVLTPSETTPAPLTKANLRQLEKMTNTGSGSGSRSAKSVYSSKTGKSTTTTVSGVKSISTTDPHFEETFRANGGLSTLDSSRHPPSNKEEIKAYLNKSRGSASPTSSQHRSFLYSLDKASNEREIEALFQGRVLKETNKEPALEAIDYGANIDKQWVAFPKNVGFNNGLSAPKPDLVEGYALRSFPQSVRQLGGSATLIHDSSTFVSHPHFAAEFKDFGKSLREGEVQAGYDGAHMVYSRDKALEFIGEKDPPRRASPLTVASDGHHWTAYSHYAHENKDKEKTEHYQNVVASGRTDEYDDFKQSYKVLRNVQDWGRKESHELRGRIQQHDNTRANRASSSSRAGSVAGSSGHSSGQGGAFRPPQRRTSDAGSRRSDGQAPSSSSKSAGRPSLTGYAGTSRLAASQNQASPPSNKAMLPPPSKSSSAGGRVADNSRASVRSPSISRYPPSASSAGSGAPRSPSRSGSAGRLADPRDTRGSIGSPSNSRYPPSASSAGSGAPRSPSRSGSAGGRVADTRGSVRSPSTSRYPPSTSSAIGPGAGVGTPKSSRSPSVSSSVSRDNRGTGEKSRDRDRRPNIVDPLPVNRRDGDRYIDRPRPSITDQYRDRRSDDGIQPVQRRRSDSPQDKPRPPRDLDRGRYRDRDDRR